jgi:hypothetical protein
MWVGVTYGEVGYRVAGLASAEGLVAFLKQRHEYHGGTAQYAWRARRHEPQMGEGIFFYPQARGTSLSAVVRAGRRYDDDPWGLRTFDYVRASEPLVYRRASFPWSANVRLTVRAVVLPWWVLVFASAVLPVLRVREVLRDRRRARRGLCRACGYDLRASEGRCPECGEGIGESDGR